MKLSNDILQEMVQTLVGEVQPERIYLFGSQARKEASEESDVDLLIVEADDFGPHRSRWMELRRIRTALARFRVPKDILVYSRTELEHRRNSPNHIIAHCLREGRLLYERS